jgi:hypothetical protein
MLSIVFFWLLSDLEGYAEGVRLEELPEDPSQTLLAVLQHVDGNGEEESTATLAASSMSSTFFAFFFFLCVLFFRCCHFRFF